MQETMKRGSDAAIEDHRPAGSSKFAPPDAVLRTGSWRWLTFLFAAANFLEVAVVAHFVLFTPIFLGTIGFTKPEIDAWTGPLAASAFIFGIWFVPFWGVLADRYGRKPLILRSYYVEVVAMVLAAAGHNLWLFVLARALSGLALGNTGLMYAALTEATPKNRVALALGIVNGSAPLGALTGGLTGGFLVARYGVHFVFGIDALVAAAIALILAFSYRDSFVPRKATPPVGAMMREAIRAVAHTPVAAMGFLVSLVSFVAFFLCYPYLPVRIEELVGASSAAVAIGLTQGYAGVATLVGSFLWGGLADRIGHRRLLSWLLLATALLYLPLYAADSLLRITAGWVLLSLVNPSIASMIFTIISLNVPQEKRGSILSLVYLPMNFAFIVGPLFGSWMARLFEVRAVFLASALTAVAAWGLFAVYMRRSPLQEPGREKSPASKGL